MHKVDLAHLRKAQSSLKNAIDQPKNEFIRDSVIQRFEFTFELSWKNLKRYFEWNQKLSEHNIKNLFREAGKQGLIDSVEQWFDFHRARNETSHTYDEKKAEEIYQIAIKFSPECKKLIDRISKLQGD